MTIDGLLHEEIEAGRHSRSPNSAMRITLPGEVVEQPEEETTRGPASSVSSYNSARRRGHTLLRQSFASSAGGSAVRNNHRNDKEDQVGEWSSTNEERAALQAPPHRTQAVSTQTEAWEAIETLPSQLAQERRFSRQSKAHIGISRRTSLRSKNGANKRRWEQGGYDKSLPSKRVSGDIELDAPKRLKAR